MTFFQTIIMGLVQGLTEFLPISSSGHLVLIKQLLNFDTDTGIVLEVMLHIGTMIAVFIAFWPDIMRLLIEMLRMIRDIWQNIKIFLHNKRADDAKRYHKILQNNYRKFVVLLIVSTIPTAIIGLLLQNYVTQAFSSLLASGIGLLITSVLLLVSDYTPDGQKIPRNVTTKAALIIGILQGLAVFPGISRLGITVSACLLLGLQKKFSVKYSYLLSIPAVIGAMIIELPQLAGAAIGWREGAYCLAGMAVAAAVGFLCIRIMIRFVQRSNFKIFSFYCAIIGIISIVCNFVIK